MEKQYIDYRSYLPSDYEYIYMLKKDSYKKYVIEFWSVWEEETQRKFFVDYMKTRKNFIKIITYKGEDIGFLDENEDNDSYEIINLCIQQNWQNKGIGTYILNEKLKEHCNKLNKIQCFVSNPVKNLYERFGFKEVERNKTHIKFEKQPN